MPTKTTVAADTSLNLGNASGQAVGRIVAHIVVTSGAATPTARGTGSAQTPVNIPYINRNNPGTTIAAGTTITATGIYEFDSTGVDIVLSLASLVASIWWTPVEG